MAPGQVPLPEPGRHLMVPRIRWILMVMADDSPCSARVPWSGLLGDTRPLLGSRVVPVNVFQVEWRGGRLSCLARASPPGGAERGHPGRSRWRKGCAAANWEGKKGRIGRTEDVGRSRVAAPVTRTPQPFLLPPLPRKEQLWPSPRWQPAAAWRCCSDGIADELQLAHLRGERHERETADELAKRMAKSE